MSDSGGNLRFYIFILVLNLVFPVFGYSLTNWPDETPTTFEVDIDTEALESIGITLVDAESHNITYNFGWVEYTELNKTYRAQFVDDVRPRGFSAPLGDGAQLQTSGVDGWLRWLLFAVDVQIKSVLSGQSLPWVSNSTIISDYDTTYNWSRFDLSTGEKLFITPFNPASNITYAVMTEGHLNFTIGRAFEADTGFNFWRFANWYVSIMVGGQSWGLPAIFGWITRILGALSILATIMLARELIGFT